MSILDVVAKIEECPHLCTQRLASGGIVVWLGDYDIVEGFASRRVKRFYLPDAKTSIVIISNSYRDGIRFESKIREIFLRNNIRYRSR